MKNMKHRKTIRKESKKKGHSMVKGKDVEVKKFKAIVVHDVDGKDMGHGLFSYESDGKTIVVDEQSGIPIMTALNAAKAKAEVKKVRAKLGRIRRLKMYSKLISILNFKDADDSEEASDEQKSKPKDVSDRKASNKKKE